MSVLLMMTVSVQCPFLMSVCLILLNLSMSTFLWKCLYHCDIFLPTFCQYLVWEVAYYPLYPAFCSCPFTCVMSLSFAFGKNSQSGLVFPIRRRVYVCVHRYLVCASLVFLMCITSLKITHSSFCIDLTPKFCNTWVNVTVLFFFFYSHQVLHFFFLFFFNSWQFLLAYLFVVILSFHNKMLHWNNFFMSVLFIFL